MWEDEEDVTKKKKMMMTTMAIMMMYCVHRTDRELDTISPQLIGLCGGIIRLHLLVRVRVEGPATQTQSTSIE